MKKILILMVILLLTPTISALNPTKVQANDTWDYMESVTKENYTETATEIYLKGQVAIATLDTARPYPLEYYSFSFTESNLTVVSNLKQIPTSIGVTQSGIIPVLHSNNITGNVTITIDNDTQVIQFNSPATEWGLIGDPAKGIISEEPENFGNLHTIHTNDYYMTFGVKQTISSTEEKGNFTVQYSDVKVILVSKTQTNKTSEMLYMPLTDRITYSGFGSEIDKEGTLHLSQAQTTAYMFSIDSNSMLPTWIAQTEPIATSNGLQLHSAKRVVEYILVDGQSSSKDDDNTILFALAGTAIAVPVAYTYVRKRKR